MQIKTTRFGEMEINSADIITFDRGILGFEGMKQYVLMNFNQDSPFSYLQSVEEPDLTFVVVDPTAIWPEYKLELSPREVSDIGVETPDDVAVLAIVTIPGDPKRMTANLQGPVLVNVKNRKGKQVIVSTDKYTTRHKIFPEERQPRTA